MIAHADHAPLSALVVFGCGLLVVGLTLAVWALVEHALARRRANRAARLYRREARDDSREPLR